MILFLREKVRSERVILANPSAGIPAAGELA